MPYSDFTLIRLEREFQLTIHERFKVFADVAPMKISDFLSEILAENVPLALAIHTEKARSEMIIAPILIELRKLVKHKISLFSGIDFSVDLQNSLNGVCDFIISKSAEQLFIKAPVMIIVEAKNENIKGGLPQCIAAMLAAQLFNARENTMVTTIYGAVTTGNSWKFLKLEDKAVFVDMDDYYINDPGKSMGILLRMVEDKDHT
jgi:hypothetical protein